MRQSRGLDTNRCSFLSTLPLHFTWKQWMYCCCREEREPRIRIVLSWSESCFSGRTHKKKLWEIFRVLNGTEDFGVANIKVSKTTWYKNCGCYSFHFPSHTSAQKQCNEVPRALKVTFHLKVVEARFTEFVIRMLVFNWCIAQSTYVPCLSR